MKVHVVYAYPMKQGLAALLHKTIVSSLREAGHEVDDLDLYKECFDPVLSEEDRTIYHDPAINRRRIDPYVKRLQACDALVLCHPVWNFSWPAMLKGWMDRTFLPGVSFRVTDDRVVPGLTNIRSLATVTTYGVNRLRALYLGDPPRMNATRFLRVVCAKDVRVRYLALYGINRVKPQKVTSFVERVRREMLAF